MLTITSKSGSTIVQIPDEEFEKLVTEFQSRTRGGSETPEQAASGWLLTQAAQRQEWQCRIDEFVEPSEEQINTMAQCIARDRYLVEYLFEHCHYNVGETLMRATGGHRMGEGMARDYSTAQAWAGLQVRENGFTAEDRNSAYWQLTDDRDYCKCRLGI